MPEEDPVADSPVRSDHPLKNRLIHEKSPYLLQHAGNPVDWFPWGEEAFERAAREDKPVFLSIGYATCHWCHVMAHESFEDEEVAALLNRNFIAIKVDREERPDIDGVYMAVCQQMTGQGGWPLTIVMTPKKKPFFAATYIPKETRFSMMGLLTLLPRITQMWYEKRLDLIRSGDRVIAAITPEETLSSGREPGTDLMDDCYQSLLLSFDAANGGFGKAPKFPTPHTLLFLLRYAARNPDSRALWMVQKTLNAIRDGGIYDQLAGGAHRYSTDVKWLVPHFEKMLYDQALLVMAYTEAYQATGTPEYKKTAEEILNYVLHCLRSPEGAFFSAEDADSPEGEGAFYVWTQNEFGQVLGPEDAALAALVFDVTPHGNYHDPERGHGFNILHRSQPLANIADSLQVSKAELEVRIESIRTRLLAARELRWRPSLDDKVLCDWNGLCIAALAQAGRIFENPVYLEAAETAMQFILTRMQGTDGGLLHRYRDGDAAITGFADDYTFVIHALIELYESAFDPRYLKTAVDLNGYLYEHFHDTRDGGFFTTADDAEALILRKKEYYDGAIPSCNSVAFMNQIRLSRLTGDAGLEKDASIQLQCISGTISRSPSAYTWFLCGLDVYLSSCNLVIVGEDEAEDTRALVSVLRSAYLPSVMMILAVPGPQASALGDVASFTRTLSMIEGKATAYLCSGHSCSLPVTDPESLLAQIELLNKSKIK
ncbi:MAG: thioredoxin domain-containing protein [Methanoregula sp.]|nr:thioredoxin domain-containing protein [Methanoregula sp.]